MALRELRISNYRSIKDLVLPLKPVNVIVGANGVGKSNLYNSIALLQAAAEGRLARAIADEGGMPSVLWAGGRDKGPVRLTLAVRLDDAEFEIALGLPQAGLSRFALDPHVKEERIYAWSGKTKTLMMERGVSSAKARDAEGKWQLFDLMMDDTESALSQLIDPHRFPHIVHLRNQFLAWRFYHTFRTDGDSPLRQPQVAVRTWALAQNGANLAAALQTIRENGDGEGLAEAIEDAFPGAKLLIEGEGQVLEVAMHFEGMGRSLRARELSDGTLRYLALLAAFLSPKPAPLIAINEPETSLHSDLLPALGRLIARIAGTSQIWLTTHAAELASAVGESTATKPIALEKVGGATQQQGRRAGAAFLAAYDQES